MESGVLALKLQMHTWQVVHNVFGACPQRRAKPTTRTCYFCRLLTSWSLSSRSLGHFIRLTPLLPLARFAAHATLPFHFGDGLRRWPMLWRSIPMLWRFLHIAKNDTKGEVDSDTFLPKRNCRLIWGQGEHKTFHEFHQRVKSVAAKVTTAGALQTRMENRSQNDEKDQRHIFVISFFNIF